jgi:hypothetical protein
VDDHVHRQRGVEDVAKRVLTSELPPDPSDLVGDDDLIGVQTAGLVPGIVGGQEHLAAVGERLGVPREARDHAVQDILESGTEAAESDRRTTAGSDRSLAVCGRANTAN